MSRLQTTAARPPVFYDRRGSSSPVINGSLKNGLTFLTPMHPVRLPVRKLGILRFFFFSPLVLRAPQRPKLRTYFFRKSQRGGA